jgi:hypothetical protein
MKAFAKLSFEELPMLRPYRACEEQARKRHPAHHPEDTHARIRLTHKLWKEFQIFGILIVVVNQAMQRKIEAIALQVALRLSVFHSLMLQNALAHMAAHAKQEVTDATPDSVLEPQVLHLGVPKEPDILKETSLGFWPQDVLDRYLPLAEWKLDTALLNDFFAHQAAVEMVQANHFEGNPILFLNFEGELRETLRTIESAVAVANEYLACQGKERMANRNGQAIESSLIIDLECLKSNTNSRWAAAIAQKWLHDASEEAEGMNAERWESCRRQLASMMP